MPVRCVAKRLVLGLQYLDIMLSTFHKQSMYVQFVIRHLLGKISRMVKA